MAMRKVDLQLMVFFYPRMAENRTFLLPVTQKQKTFQISKKNVSATTFARLQAAVRASRVMVDPDFRVDGAGRGFQAKGGALDPGPRSSGDQLVQIPSGRAFPPKTPGPATRP